jgi:hypothetical protein
MSYLTIFLGLIGLLSAFLFFYLLKFKAFSKQTNRGNRIRWKSYIPYKNKDSDKSKKSS